VQNLIISPAVNALPPLSKTCVTLKLAHVATIFYFGIYENVFLWLQRSFHCPQFIGSKISLLMTSNVIFFQYAIRVTNKLTQTSFLSKTPHSESNFLFLNYPQMLHFTTVMGGKNKFPCLICTFQSDLATRIPNQQTPATMVLLTYSMEQGPSWEANFLQLVKKFPAFYVTRRFLTALTSAHHLSLSWVSPIH
jgi:hypothetical protein